MKDGKEVDEKGRKMKTLYIKFPFNDWLDIAKKALNEQKTRGDVILQIIRDHFKAEV